MRGRVILKRKSKLLILGAVAVCSISMIASFAILKDSKSVYNVFKEKGNGEIQLIESNWNSENAKNIYPSQSVVKNPQIKNIGNIDEYAYIQVGVPIKNVKTVSDDEKVIDAKPTELFTYEVNKDWVLLEEKEDKDYAVKVYGYKNPIPPDAETTCLFESVDFVNVLQGELQDDTSLSIKVQGIGIQSDNNSSLEEAFKGDE